ncbi:hypothetical protein Tco_0803183 [Tanacetum coccineum]|uniref:Uncharacterized protein n=1 Tax=Tanacetum coccineum TaxID=301880 RepID=A0ABQ5A1T7_9ASTR
MMDQGEDFGIERDSNKSTNKESESTWGMANVLSSMGAANILASGAKLTSEKDSTTACYHYKPLAVHHIQEGQEHQEGLFEISSPIPINIPSISKEDKGKGIMIRS